MTSAQFKKAYDLGIKIMSDEHDPFHTEKHVLKVEKIALEIYKSLPEKEKKEVDLQILRLVCIWHDVSRKYLKSHLLFLGLLDEPLSKYIAKKEFNKIGLEKEITDKICMVLNNHQKSILGSNPNSEIIDTVFSEADKISIYSAERFEHAVKLFLSNKFPKRLFNYYILVLIYILKTRSAEDFQLEKSKRLLVEEHKNLFLWFQRNRKIIQKLLHKPVYTLLYTEIEGKKN